MKGDAHATPAWGSGSWRRHRPNEKTQSGKPKVKLLEVSGKLGISEGQVPLRSSETGSSSPVAENMQTGKAAKIKEEIAPSAQERGGPHWPDVSEALPGP